MGIFGMTYYALAHQDLGDVKCSGLGTRIFPCNRYVLSFICIVTLSVGHDPPALTSGERSPTACAPHPHLSS